MGNKFLLPKGLDVGLVQERVDFGMKSIKEIHESMVDSGDIPEMRYITFWKYFRDIKTKLVGFEKKNSSISKTKSKRKKFNLDVDLVNKRIKEGANSVKELHEYMVEFEDIPKISYSCFNVNYLNIKDQLNLPDDFGKRGPKKDLQRNRYNQLSDLVNDHPEYKIKEFAKVLGVSRVTVSNYFKNFPELKEKYKQNKLVRNSENQRLVDLLNSGQSLVDTLAAGLLVKAYEEDFESAKRAHKLIIDYLADGNKNKKWINRFLVVYENLKIKKETGSYPKQKYLEEISGLSQNIISKYLLDMGFDSREHIVFDGSEREEALVRGYKFGISISSLCDFLDLSNSSGSVNHMFTKREINRNCEVMMFNFGNYGNISLHKTANLYESIDIGFNFQEAVEYAEIPEVSARVLIEKSDLCKPIIIDSLRVLFDEPEHDRPYMTENLREKLRGWTEDK